MYCLTEVVVVLEMENNFRNKREINIGASHGSAEDKDWLVLR